MKTILAFILALASFSCLAQQGFYAGGSLGQSRVNIDFDSFFSGTTTTNRNTDETDSAFKVYAGYKFSRNIAAEVSYLNLGEFSASGRVTAVNGVPITPQTLTFTFKPKNVFSVAGILGAPFNRLYVFGKLGFYSMKLETTATASSTASESNSGSDVLLGIGAEYALNHNIGIRAEWEVFKNVGNRDTTGEGDIGLLSVGAVYRF